MPKTPKICPVVLMKQAGRMGTITCGAEIVRRPEDGRDPYCPRCGSKFPRQSSLVTIEPEKGPQ